MMRIALRSTLLAAALASAAVPSVAAQGGGLPQDHPLYELALLEGSWAGRMSGSLGTGTGYRQYRFIVRDRYLLLTHVSYRAPQELSPEGDAHEEWSIYSYDGERDVIVLRQFVVEGFVIRYTCEIEQTPMRITCESEATEGASGLRLRTVGDFSDPDHFTETFEIRGPDGALQVRMENAWLRTSERR